MNDTINHIEKLLNHISLGIGDLRSDAYMMKEHINRMHLLVENTLQTYNERLKGMEDKLKDLEIRNF